MDTKKTLDGTVEDVKARLSGLSNDDLLALRAAENDGQKRGDVLAVLDSAISDSDASRAGGRVVTSAAVHQTTAADLDGSAPADIAAATTFSTSGAPVQLVPDVDPSHPAVDDNPRAGTTVTSNRIDFNNPTLSGQEAVEQMLGEQKSTAMDVKA